MSAAQDGPASRSETSGAAASGALPAEPREEAIHAMEQARQALDQAVRAMEETDDEQLARAYELAAGSTDHIARALWFLRRLERERAGSAAGAGG